MYCNYKKAYLHSLIIHQIQNERHIYYIKFFVVIKEKSNTNNIFY